MHNVVIALIILAIELVLIGLGGAIYFLARRKAGGRAGTGPAQDLKALAHQLVLVHEAAMRRVQCVEGSRAADPMRSEAAATLKTAVARLRSVAAQVATGRVSAAAVGQEMLEAQDEVLRAWQMTDAGTVHEEQAPGPVAVSDEIQEEIRVLAPNQAIPEAPRNLDATEIDAPQNGANGSIMTDGLSMIPEQDLPNNELLDSLLDMRGVFPGREAKAEERAGDSPEA